jgi:hypothetical protein
VWEGIAVTYKKADKVRILTYVTGLLHFYGVMTFDDLFSIVADMISARIEEDDLRVLLERCVLDDDGAYVFFGDDDIYYDIEVADIDWVLEEQKKRDNLSYRPVSEEEAHLVVEDGYFYLWNAKEKEFYRWLLKKGGYDQQLALTLVLEYGSAVKNDMPLSSIIQNITQEMVFADEEEFSQAAALIKEYANHVPRWVLKGWSLNEARRNG